VKALSDRLQKLERKCDDPATAATVTIPADLLWSGFSEDDLKSFAQRSARVYRGKVREMIELPGANGRHVRLFMAHTDRLSAFDRYIGLVPGKGMMLAALSEWWLRQANSVVETHLVAKPDPRVIEVKPTTPIKVEVVVRGAMAGSMMRAAASGETHWCGEKIPVGVKAWELLPEPMITPTTKAAAFEHDENASAGELIARGICSAGDWEQIRSMALGIFAMGQRLLKSAGWILADTKYEFGRTSDGRIILIDEIHTPDSSRFWIAETYEARLKSGATPDMLDKETIRRWLLAQGFSGHGPVPDVPPGELVRLARVYCQVVDRLCGKGWESAASPTPQLDAGRGTAQLTPQDFSRF